MMQWVVERLISLLGPIATMAKEKRDLQDNALRSISHALQETKLYYRDLGLGKERSRDIESQLAKYWAAAAIPLRHIDQELAMNCENKAEYWLSPETFSEEDIKQMGIKLTDLSAAYRKLVAPKFTGPTRRAGA
ncbi:hypothetical protein H010_10196 [Hydrogenophaga taeniospiralis CCUG 15921]|uniref:Uncharacterized protein n=3 Tax=Hydrogenophaga TaxID=47420 RepID=A0A9X4NQ47_9BURK|nr:hypothetical protein [Hydrogenophaga taeniospiralis CCUG 15921]